MLNFKTAFWKETLDIICKDEQTKTLRPQCLYREQWMPSTNGWWKPLKTMFQKKELEDLPVVFPKKWRIDIAIKSR
jgi:hypothetical protein